MKATWFGIGLLCGLVSVAALRAQNADTPGIHRPAFVESVFSTGTLAKFSLGTMYDQATVQVPEWGSGASGLRKRAEWRMAGLLSRATAEYWVARLRDTDPGYERCRCKGFGPRSRHAFVSEFVERRMDRNLAAPVARFAGLATSVTVTSLGEHSGAGSAAGHAATLVGSDVGFNLLHEFWPEIRRTLLFRRK